MSGRQQFSDEELTAYVDGEADTVLLSAIDVALSGDAKLRHRIDALSIPTGDIKSVFDKMLLSSPAYPAHIYRPEVHSHSWKELLRPVAMTAAICLTTGWIAAGYVNREKASDWHQSVATYQVLYVKDTLAQVSQSPIAAQEELTRAAAVLGKTISLDAMNNSSSLVYKRAQILGFEGRPLVQLAFLSETGVPIALCIIKNTKPSETVVASGELLGMKSASWSIGDFDYLLIGGSDAAMITETANGLAARL